ncbi:hypothetical protein BAE44_0024010 [Dichanthelium oligosanthes]|uniref:RNase H type-1 domain-containing protein n=1 Tax=Dichanthelium oligosanthes TaxID=888268 RepID=A0A1E5UQ90_9POAL|nr:hypothetical protein BAE44_0024010 [Dichanthelium oligosanthes]
MRGSTGAVIRDDHGNFVAASSYFIDFALDASTTEAISLRNGLYLANEMGCNKLIIQSDCLEVVETMKDGGFSATAAAPIYIYDDICIKLILFLMYLICTVQERLTL